MIETEDRVQNSPNVPPPAIVQPPTTPTPTQQTTGIQKTPFAIHELLGILLDVYYV